MREIKIGKYTVQLVETPNGVFAYEASVYGDDPDTLIGFDADDSKTAAVVNALNEAKAAESDINAVLAEIK